MAFTIEFVRENQASVAQQVAAALKQTFNGSNYKVDVGLTYNEPGIQPDFSVRVSDAENAEWVVPAHVKNFAEQKVQEIMPGSKPLMLPWFGLVMK